MLSELRTISHVDIIRIHSRVPCTLPARITDRLVSVLKKYHPLFLNTHFNHPDEITEQSSQACLKIADAGIPVGCQTVLLKGVNDSPETMAMLMRKLIAIRVKPYYLHHPDPVAGTGHFRPSLDTGLSIMNHMRGNISGICIPQYMIDLPGGYGKAPVLYGNMDRISDDRIMVNNYQGHRCTYDFK